MDRLNTAALSFVAALATSGCHEKIEPYHHADPVRQETGVETEISFLRANLSLASIKCIAGKFFNARLALEDALKIRASIENNLSPAERTRLDAEIVATRTAIDTCLRADSVHPQ